MGLRKLPVATTAAVHGKLIGGGVALSLAAQYRISSQEATFNFGNLPRGMNPLFMLSRSLALVAGW
jgi:enoyl-CoA hydratase/carnithine racemase